MRDSIQHSPVSRSSDERMGLIQVMADVGDPKQ